MFWWIEWVKCLLFNIFNLIKYYVYEIIRVNFKFILCKYNVNICDMCFYFIFYCICFYVVKLVIIYIE